MQINADWITDPSSQRIMALLNSTGVAYFVGGCVRNALLGVSVSDLDISTNLHPTQVLALVKDAGLRAVPTGIDHGTITAVVDKIPFEITTFRKDVATDGRRAVVAFSENMRDDALRRDFTMNALYADQHGTIHDPLGGLPDLMARRVRFIEDAHQRIAEDYLRILRFFRFHAWYGDPTDGLDAEALAACAAGIEGIAQLSKERVTAEVLKLLSAPDPVQSVAAMHATGILSQILPGADPSALGPLVHLEEGRDVDPLRRLAVIGGTPTQTLRLSKKQSLGLAQIAAILEQSMGPAQVAYRYSRQAALNASLVLHASLSQPLPADLDAQLDHGAYASCPVRASDLQDQYSGRALGQKLKALEETWIASGFSMTRDELLD